MCLEPSGSCANSEKWSDPGSILKGQGIAEDLHKSLQELIELQPTVGCFVFQRKNCDWMPYQTQLPGELDWVVPLP